MFTQEFIKEFKINNASFGLSKANSIINFKWRNGWCYENKSREQEGGFLSMLLATLVSSLLGNLLAGKGVMRIGKRAVAMSQGKGMIKAG